MKFHIERLEERIAPTRVASLPGPHTLAATGGKGSTAISVNLSEVGGHESVVLASAGKGSQAAGLVLAEQNSGSQESMTIVRGNGSKANRCGTASHEASWVRRARASYQSRFGSRP